MYREIPVEISWSHKIEDRQPDYFYFVNMMPFDPPRDGEEIDPELESRRAKLEAQRDVYRGEKIDHLTPEDLLAPREGCFAGWREKTSDVNSDNSGADDSDKDDNGGNDDNKTISAADENAKTANQNDDDVSSDIAEPASPNTTNPTGRSVHPAKLPDDFRYAGRAGGLPESDYEPIPAPGWASEPFEDDIGDARHVFEHSSNLNGGEQTQLVDYDSDQGSLFPPDEHEPPRPLEIIATTQNGEKVRILLDDKVVLE